VIPIAGSARRAYTFPAPLDEAFRFNADLDRMLPLLPHIEVLGATGDPRRLCYSATEGGLYDVRIHCTVVAEVDERNHEIRIHPFHDPAPERAGFRSMSGAGRYESTIRFHAASEADTRIEYALKLSARIPTPGSLRLIPERIVQARAERRFRTRLEEILDGFVERSIAAYRGATATERPGSATVRASRGHRA
jgi:hypothetical protein